MLEVKVKGPAIKLQGIWKFKGETSVATQEEYLENKEYLELVKGEISEKKVEKLQNAQDGTNDEEDNELIGLREKAKSYGIKGSHNMKKETLIAKIQEIETSNDNEETLEEIEPQE